MNTNDNLTQPGQGFFPELKSAKEWGVRVYGQYQTLTGRVIWFVDQSESTIMVKPDNGDTEYVRKCTVDDDVAAHIIKTQQMSFMGESA